MKMYKLTYQDIVIRLSDYASIPKDDKNGDYRDYLAWLAKGGVPQEADPYTKPRVIEIQAELQLIDSKSIRALREGDSARIAALEAQAETLRVELRSLTQ